MSDEAPPADAQPPPEGVEPEAPALAEEAPVEEAAAPVEAPKAQAADGTSAAVEETTPVVESSSTVTETVETTVVEETTTTVVEETTTTVVEETTTVVQEGSTTVVQETTSTVEESSSSAVVQESSSTVQETSGAAEEVSTAAEAEESKEEGEASPESGTKDAPGEGADAPSEAPAATEASEGAEAPAATVGSEAPAPGPTSEAPAEEPQTKGAPTTAPAAPAKAKSSVRGGDGPGPSGEYNPESFKPELGENMFAADSVQLRDILSMESTKRNNLFLMDQQTLLTSAGNNVVLLDIETGEAKYMAGLDGGGIGAVCPHPDRKHFAVAEKNTVGPPNVYIYEYPSLKLRRVLRNGTEAAYTALAFNDDGTMLATVGSFSDYMLTLWNWDEEKVVLRAKAFSQEVFNVKFSSFFDGSLTTSGTGHIRFWKMASTFTGLKLQGQIGKFGAVEISDVADYAEFPDSKVLSSTEFGELIIWDGGLIKCLVNDLDGKPCHNGPIEVVQMEPSSGDNKGWIRTAGADGCVKFWDFEKMNEIEPEEDSHTVQIAPLKVVKIGDGQHHIKTLIDDTEGGRWIMLDEKGAIIVTTPEGQMLNKVAEFHSGGIVQLATCPSAHFAVTAGSDGSIRLYDYRSKPSLLYKRSFGSPVTSMLMLPPHIDPSQKVTLVGFKDGLLRALMRDKSEWKLAAAFKPHKGVVSSISVSPDGKVLASAGKDGSVFFFSISSPIEFEPIAFTVVKAAVNTISFSEDSTKLLMGCETGEVMEVNVPDPETLDTSKTFEVTLPIRYYDFVLPKPPKAKKAKVDEGKTTEGEEGNAEKEGGENNAKDGDGKDKPDGEGEDEKKEGEKKEGEEEEEEEEEEEPEADENFPIMHAQYLPGEDGKFLLSLSGKAAGKLYECDFEDPGLVVAYGAPDAAVSDLRFSHSNRFLLYGSQKGQVRVAPLAGEGKALPSTEYWEATLHDSQRGAVNGVALSFDDNYLLSVSDDGSFYVSDVAADGLRGERQDGKAWEITEKDLTVEEAEDITDAATYSIEEAKQKTEQDNLLAAADQKRMGVREYLNKIRAEFDNLLKQNEQKPEAQRLPREEFEIDPGLRSMIEEETADKEDAARKELAWESEKAKLMLGKARKWFLDEIEVERIVLHGFQNRKSVTSFRTRKLSEEMQVEIARVHNLMDEDAKNGRRTSQDEAEEGNQEQNAKAAGMAASGAAGGKGAAGNVANEALDGKKLTKADLRRIARQKREAEWEVFNATKPDKDSENPADMAAIKDAEDNMGDFKLKSDPDFVVPEEERINKEKKRRQMILLEEGMYNIRMEFNRRFLALREVKRKVCNDIMEKNKRLQELHASLKVSTALFHPSMQPEETPEARENITDEDLEEFANELSKQEASGSGGGGGFGGFGGGGGNSAAAPPASGAAAAKAGAAGGKSSAPTQEADDPRAKAASQAPLSDLQVLEMEIQKRREECEMQKLMGEIADMISAFDEALSKLRREKFKLEADLKQAEIKKLVMYQELKLLKVFEKREDALNEKLQGKLAEKRDVVDKIKDCQEKLETKKEEVDNLVEVKKAVAVEFDEMVEEGHTFREPLLKIFLRKIKRSKNKNQGDSDNEDYDSDAEDEEDEDEDEDFDDEDEDEEVCPPGCDQVLYEKVCDLREKRLDQEDVIGEFQKGIDNLKKEKEQYSKKQKLVETALAKINQDIVEFQKEKQGKLNEIDVVVTLSMHQIEYLVDQKLPYDLSQALVFSNTELEKLKSRIKEQDAEKIALRRQQQELRKEHQQLLRDKKTKEARISELDKRAYNVQMLKFGQEIDLELLDRIGTTRGAEELQEQLKIQEASLTQELKLWDRKIQQAQDQMMALTIENTECLQTVTALSKQQKNLETKLTKTQTSLFNDPVAQRRKEIAERDHLVQEVNAQAKEINSLKAQIAVLRRKDTSMYE